MKFIDLNKQYHQAKQAIDAAIAKVLEHGRFIMGPEVVELEQKLANLISVKHCIATSSGTTALQVALMALEVGSGDEVIVPAFSFFATAETVLLLGAIPVFVDVDKKTYNLNPDQLEHAITAKTKAIMPVSLYGQCADYDRINAIANAHHLAVIDDAAQSFGAKYKNRCAGTLTTISCTSFFPSKPLGCYGDGGACFTDDDELAKRIRLIINHGQEKRYHHTTIGINGRFDSLQAGVLLAKLELFAEEMERRQQVAKWYDEALAGEVITPYIESYNLSAYAQYTIQVEQRDTLRAHLDSQQIPTAVHYPKGLHQQPAISNLMSSHQSYPVTESLAEHVLSLPFHPYLDLKTVQFVCEQIIEASVCTRPA